jgi:hypothetical protein
VIINNLNVADGIDPRFLSLLECSKLSYAVLIDGFSFFYIVHHQPKIHERGGRFVLWRIESSEFCRVLSPGCSVLAAQNQSLLIAQCSGHSSHFNTVG